MGSDALPWKKLRTSNSTSTTAFGATTIAQVITDPSSAVSFGNKSDLLATDWVIIQPYGKGSDGATFEMLVWGGNLCSDGVTINKIPLGSWTCTLSANIGINGGLLATDERICDTLAIGSGFSALEGVSVVTRSPGSDMPATVLVDRMGCQIIGAEFRMIDATGANALVREM